MSKEAIAKAVAGVAQKTPAGDWIVGRGWDEGYFATRQDPTAADLDPVTSAHPAVLSGIGGHSVWVNSLALKRAGFTKHRTRPVGASYATPGSCYRAAAGGGAEPGGCGHAGYQHIGGPRTAHSCGA